MYKIVFVVNNPDFLITHRLDICRQLLKQGFELHIICPDKRSVSMLKGLGFIFHDLDFGRDRLNPISEFLVVFRLMALFNKI